MAIELVGRAAEGDRVAFDTLVAGSLDRLYAIARLVVRDPDAAEDAVQDALVKAWRELPRLRDRTKFDAWLHRLLVNAATDQHRGRRRIRVAVSRLSETRDQRDFATDIAVAEELSAAFERLRLEQRVVLVLHHYLGLTPGEIAETLRVPPGTARSRLHYATEAMRAAMDAGGRAAGAQMVGKEMR